MSIINLVYIKIDKFYLNFQIMRIFHHIRILKIVASAPSTTVYIVTSTVSYGRSLSLITHSVWVATIVYQAKDSWPVFLQCMQS